MLVKTVQGQAFVETGFLGHGRERLPFAYDRMSPWGDKGPTAELLFGIRTTVNCQMKVTNDDDDDGDLDDLEDLDSNEDNDTDCSG
jgi:hypothetical protein